MHETSPSRPLHAVTFYAVTTRTASYYPAVNYQTLHIWFNNSAAAARRWSCSRAEIYCSWKEHAVCVCNVLACGLFDFASLPTPFRRTLTHFQRLPHVDCRSGRHSACKFEREHCANYYPLFDRPQRHFWWLRPVKIQYARITSQSKASYFEMKSDFKKHFRQSSVDVFQLQNFHFSLVCCAENLVSCSK